MSGSVSEQIQQRREAMKRQERLRNLGFFALVAVLGAILVGVLVWQSRNDPAKVIVNVNTASAKELAYLPEVGPEIARQIIKQRPYTSPEDLAEKVKGIGPKTLEKMRPRLKFE